MGWAEAAFGARDRLTAGPSTMNGVRTPSSSGGHDELGPVSRMSGGVLAGVAAGLPVAALLTYQGMLAEPVVGVVPLWLTYLVSMATVGAITGLVLGYRPHALASAASGGMLLGLLGWLLWSLTLDPLLGGQLPTWSVGAAAGSYRRLVADLLHGGLTGVLWQGVAAVLAARSRPRRAPPTGKARVVIVGGGFAGVGATRRFERLAPRAGSPDVTLLSDSNFLLFTPMLAEAASGALEPAAISAPIRAAAGHTRFHQGTVCGIDTATRIVRLSVGAETRLIPYDHLVLAVGSVPRFLDLPGVAEHAFTLKSLADATRLRNHVLTLLERADRLEPGEERGRLLTFVVAGGGFAGTEIVAELFDLVHGVSHFYPALAADEPRFVLIHSGQLILPELSPKLGAYALDRLRARGIEFHLGERVAEAGARHVSLTDGTRLPTATFVWTAGNRPSPLVDAVGGQHAGGGLVTDPLLRVVGLDGVWAVGDCARIPDPAHDGSPYPPTAQHALRQGRTVADNITAVLAGRPPRAFRFSTIGVLVALGHRTAAAEIRGHRFSGVAAWVLWRGLYLAKLPGAEKRVRVLLDWLLDLAFPRDIVITDAEPLSRPPAPEPAEPRERNGQPVARGPAR
ncbi:MAG TPA: NAD(P)/FAD-dependent oxidoreductase [Pseudonocardia sp.]|uniref:NAD(P)/FAD-dependent oxidoreductase n=1 Tax=Pseudonocardia sp. TaxID=60912 RepID=UPI002F40FA3F